MDTNGVEYEADFEIGWRKQLNLRAKSIMLMVKEL